MQIAEGERLSGSLMTTVLGKVMCSAPFDIMKFNNDFFFIIYVEKGISSHVAVATSRICKECYWQGKSTFGRVMWKVLMVE